MTVRLDQNAQFWARELRKIWPVSLTKNSGQPPGPQERSWTGAAKSLNTALISTGLQQQWSSKQAVNRSYFPISNMWYCMVNYCQFQSCDSLLTTWHGAEFLCLLQAGQRPDVSYRMNPGALARSGLNLWHFASRGQKVRSGGDSQGILGTETESPSGTRGSFETGVTAQRAVVKSSFVDKLTSCEAHSIIARCEATGHNKCCILHRKSWMTNLDSHAARLQDGHHLVACPASALPALSNRLVVELHVHDDVLGAIDLDFLQ